ncbi:MAG: HEAT repeat domain-containing protein [Polyangiales bacterium]
MIPPLAPTFDAALRDVAADAPRFRIAAAHRLADPPDDRRQEATSGLQTLAQDAVGAVREAALESIGELGASEALSIAVSAFDDPDRSARQAAVLAAGRIAPDRSRDAIEALLDDDRPEMRFSAVWTLTRIGAAAPVRIASRLEDEDEEVRLLVIECLAELNATDHVEGVAARLDDRSSRVRFAAARALATLGDDRGLAVLEAGLRDNALAFDAAVALGDLRNQGSRPVLTTMAQRRLRSPILRAAAARGLVMLGDPLGTEIIRKILRSWRIEARQYAVELVGELQLTQLLPDLARALRRSPEVARPVYESTLERLAETSRDAKALLASLREADHAP